MNIKYFFPRKVWLQLSSIFRRIFRLPPPEEFSGNMFTAYIIPNAEVENYHKDQFAFRSDPNILRTAISFVSAEEAMEQATKDVVEKNIADLTTHTIIIEPGIALAWAD